MRWVPVPQCSMYIGPIILCIDDEELGSNLPQNKELLAVQLSKTGWTARASTCVPRAWILILASAPLVHQTMLDDLSIS
jgi:hypothetical protein